MKSALVIGLGSIGRRHLRNLASLYPRSDLTVLRHRAQSDPEAEALGARVFDDPDRALDQSYDLIVLATPSANHIDLLPRLIARAERLLVEKPIVSTLEDCDALKQAIENAPPALRISGFNFRYLPSLKKVRTLVQSGVLGRIVRASFSAGLWLPDWRTEQDYRLSYSADAARGGGVELDLVHEIDIARWLFGDLELEYSCGRKLSSLEIQANDTAMMVLRPFASGPLIHISLDYVARQRVRHYEIVGDKGGIQWDLAGRLVHVTPDGTDLLSNSSNDFDVSKTYVSMLQAISSQFEPSKHAQSLSDGIESTRLAIKARDIGSLK